MEFDIKTIFHKMCRVCLTLCENGVSICSSNIVNMITACTSVQIWMNDELPNQLCDKCFLQLQNSFNFKQLVEISDIQLRKSLNINKQGKTETQTAVYIKVERDANFNDNSDRTKTSQFKIENTFSENKAQNTPAITNVKVKNEEHTNANDSILCYPKTIAEFKAEFLLDLNDEGKPNAKSKNSRSIRVPCKICKKPVTWQYLKTHIKAHSKQFSCIYCNKVLTNQSLLDSHLTEFHNAEYILSKTLPGNRNITTDQLSNPHPVNLQQSNTSVENSSNSNKAPDDSHDTIGEIPYDREPCEVCGKLIVKRQRPRHMEIHSEKRRMYKCTECDKSFFSNQSMKYHFEVVHKKTYRFECTICDKKFHRKIYYERHQAVHRNENPFHCSYCEKRFNYKNGLLTHIRAVHFKLYKKKSTSRRPCTVCGKLILERKMNVHLKVHKTERRTFVCPLCPDKKFLYKASLESHTKIKHENIVPEYLCTVCGRRAKTGGALKVHMITHNTEKNFACKVCGLKFKGYSGVRYHMRSAHLKLKPYTCEVCSRSFFTDTCMKHHMRIHTGERPHVCSLCQRPFRQKSALETHKRLVHLGEKRRKKASDGSVVPIESLSRTAL